MKFTLHSIIKSVDSTKMDFCDDFSRIQTILNYCNRSLRPLQKIQFSGGNEIYIDEITSRLRRFMIQRKYTNQDNDLQTELYDKELRSITYFLILNTESTFKYDLSEDYSISHVLNTVPQLTKFLLLTCIWDLKLDKYFYECIAYSPTWFSLQFIENAVDSLKFADPYEVLDRVDHLVTAIYQNLSRSDYRILSVSERKIILTKYFDFTMDLLRHFFTPDAEKFSHWKQFQLSIYAGYVLKHILNIILKCFKLYKDAPVFQVHESLDLFSSLMSEEDKMFDTHNTQHSEIVLDSMHRINTALLNSLENNVLQINFNTFLSWVEVDLYEDTLQYCVGVKAHQVIELIQLDECFKHSVAEHLKSISIKPLTLEERCKQASIRVILHKLDSLDTEPDQRIVWISEFISRGNLLYENDECLETLEGNVKYLNFDHICQILKYIFDARSSNEDKLIKIVLLALENFTVNEIQEIIFYSFEVEEACGKPKINFLELDNFANSLTECFNKSTKNFYSKSTLGLVLQNPKKFYDKLFQQLLKSKPQLLDFVEFFKCTPKLTNKYLLDYITELLNCDTLAALPINESQLIPQLFHQIYLNGLQVPTDFIQDFLYKQLTKAIQDKEMTKILRLMQAFALIFHKTMPPASLTAPILVMAANVLDQCRWDLVKYTEELETICIITIDFIQDVLKRFLPIATEKDKTWILTKIKQLKPMTRYYYHKLSLSIDVQPPHFDMFLFDGRFDQLTQSEVSAFLCEVFVRCTKKETIWLARNRRLHPFFHDIIIILSEIITTSTISNTINCFRHCIQCYIGIVTDTLLPLTATIADKHEIFKKQIRILATLQHLEIYPELFTNIHFLLLEIVEDIVNEKRQQQRIPTMCEIKLAIEQLKDCEAKQLFLQKFDILNYIE